MSEERVLQPVYMNQFRCIGSECEDTCCGGWQITIDKKTYKEYKKVSDRDFQKKLRVSTVRIKESNHANAYAAMKLNEKNECNFLTEDKLCGIQQELGERSLCHTCSVYPRMVNKLDETFERSGAVSCPEVARLALLNKNGIDFEYNNAAITTKLYSADLQTTSYKSNSVEHNFWNIRHFIIETLQNRNFPLWERLLFVGLTIQKLQRNQYSDASDITNLMSSMNNLIHSGNASRVFSEVPEKLDIQYKILQLIAEARKNEGIHHQKFNDYYNQFLAGIKYSPENDSSDNLRNYKEALKGFRKIESDYEFILENYLVNHVFSTLFPVSKDNNYLREFGFLILHYSLIRIHLIGIHAHYDQTFNKDVVISFIQSFSRNIGHNKSYLNKIYSFLEENELNNLAVYTILLKN